MRWGRSSNGTTKLEGNEDSEESPVNKESHTPECEIQHALEWQALVVLAFSMRFDVHEAN